MGFLFSGTHCTCACSILAIAYSRYRAIPAIDIDIQNIYVGTLTSGPAASRAARHACMHAMKSLYLSRRGQQAQHEFLIYR